MNRVAIALLAIALVVVSAFFALPRISIALLAKNYGLDISYKSAYFIPRIGPKESGGLRIDVYLSEARISKKGAVAGCYENLSALVSAPFDGSLKYRRIAGIIRPRSGHLYIDDLVADADDMKVSLKGIFFYAEDKADLDLVIQFSQNLLKKIPREVSETILKESPNGWHSLSVRLKGSFKSPAIEVTGRLFKLSIKEISGN